MRKVVIRSSIKNLRIALKVRWWIRLFIVWNVINILSRETPTWITWEGIEGERRARSGVKLVRRWDVLYYLSIVLLKTVLFQVFTNNYEMTLHENGIQHKNNVNDPVKCDICQLVCVYNVFRLESSIDVFVFSDSFIKTQAWTAQKGIPSPLLLCIEW